MDERVHTFHGLFHFCGRAHDDVHRKWSLSEQTRDGSPSLRWPLFSLHHDEQIHITVRRWLPMGIGAEQDHLLRRKSVYDALCNFFEQLVGHGLKTDWCDD